MFIDSNLSLALQGSNQLKKKTIVGLTLAAIAIAGLLTIAASGVLVSSQTIPNSGVITSANIGLYSDSSGTQSISSISWGTVTPGNIITRTLYVKNTGNIPLTLSMTKTNWIPTSANGPITLLWDRDSTLLNVNQVVAATLTLSVSSSTNGITTFSFNIIITGTE